MAAAFSHRITERVRLWPEPARRVIITIGLALVYYVSGRLALLLAIPPVYATAVWPAAGIALAGVLVWGNGVWPGVLLGSFFVNIGTSFDPTAIWKSIAVAAGIGAGATLQAVAGAFLVRRYVGV